MVFILDNYDSFTYNLAQYLGELGESVEVRRNDQVTLADIESLRPQRIVISPGPCTPHEAGISISLMTSRITAGGRHLTLVWAVGAVILGLGLLATGRHSHPQAIESESQTGYETSEGIGEH